MAAFAIEPVSATTAAEKSGSRARSRIARRAMLLSWFLQGAVAGFIRVS